MNTATTTKPFVRIVTEKALGLHLSLLDIANEAGIAYTRLATHLETPNLLTVHEIASIALVIGVTVPELITAAL